MIATARHPLAFLLPVIAGPLGLLVGCTGQQDPDDLAVARAYGERMPWSQLRQVIPLELPPEDSVAMAQSYVQNWLKQQVLLHHSSMNVAGIEREIEAQLREYRNSLVIFAYEQAIVEQKLDTVVKADEIQAYYERNQVNFELKDNIMRIRWFKVSEDDKRTLKRLEDHFLSGSDERMSEVERWLAQRGIAITDHSAGWSTLQAIRAEVPVLPEDPEAPALRPGRKVHRDGPITWFVDILEHRARQSAAPLELVRQDIRSIIINQRKVHLLERMREELYREALERGDIEMR